MKAQIWFCIYLGLPLVVIGALCNLATPVPTTRPYKGRLACFLYNASIIVCLAGAVIIVIGCALFWYALWEMIK